MDASPGDHPPGPDPPPNAEQDPSLRQTGITEGTPYAGLSADVSVAGQGARPTMDASPPDQSPTTAPGINATEDPYPYQAVISEVDPCPGLLEDVPILDQTLQQTNDPSSRQRAEPSSDPTMQQLVSPTELSTSQVLDSIMEQAIDHPGAYYVLTYNELAEASLSRTYDVLIERDRYISEATEPMTLWKLYQKSRDLKKNLRVVELGMIHGMGQFNTMVTHNGSRPQRFPLFFSGFIGRITGEEEPDKVLSLWQHILGCDNLAARWDEGPPEVFEADASMIKTKVDWIRDTVRYLDGLVGTKFRVEVQAYKEIGKKLIDTSEMKTLKKLLVNIDRQETRVRGFYETFDSMYASCIDWKPFILVCASSGTGKTQIPFTFCQDTVPLLYLLDKAPVDGSRGDQPVYHLFDEITRKFDELCADDKLSLNRYVRTGVQYFAVDVFDKIRADNVRLKSVGFLCAVFKKIIQLYRQRDDEAFDWIEAELDVDVATLNFEAKDLKSGALEFSAFKNLGMLKPVIFIDECDTSHEQLMFVFKRNLIRSLDLVPIIMGTDSKLHNIVFSANNRCRTRGVNDLWGFIFHRLPEFPKEVIDNLVLKLKADLFEQHVDDLDKKIEFIEIIAECAAHERPLLVGITLETLRKEVTAVDEFDAEYSLQAILRELYDVFYNRKNLDNSFREAQLRFLQHHLRPIRRFENTGMSSLINTHLAFIWDRNLNIRTGMTDDQIERIIQTSTGIITLALHRVNGVCSPRNGHLIKFNVSEYFHSFKRAPLSTLAFASSCDGLNYRNLFPSDPIGGIVERMSVMEVDSNVNTSSAISDSDDMNGDFLENRCKYALIASLTANGFKTKSLTEWIPYFCAEFEYSYMPGGQAPIIEYDSPNVYSAWDKISMPFCPPISEEWPLNLLGYVQEKLDCLVGRFENTANRTEVDGLLYLLKKVSTHGSSNSVQLSSSMLKEEGPFLTLECKNHREVITFSDITEILSKFERYSATVQMIIASQFGGMNDITSKLTEYILDKKMYAVYVDRGPNCGRVQLLCGNPQDEGASCLILFPVDMGPFIEYDDPMAKRARLDI